MANQITDTKFNAVKVMLKGGASVKEAAQYLQLGEATVYRIKAAETFAEYKQELAALAAKATAAKKAKAGEPTNKEEDKPHEVVKEIRQSVTIQATHYMEEQLRKTNELLQQISAKLAYIVNDLYGTKEG